MNTTDEHKTQSDEFEIKDDFSDEDLEFDPGHQSKEQSFQEETVIYEEASASKNNSRSIGKQIAKALVFAVMVVVVVLFLGKQKSAKDLSVLVQKKELSVRADLPSVDSELPVSQVSDAAIVSDSEYVPSEPEKQSSLEAGKISSDINKMLQHSSEPDKKVSQEGLASLSTKLDLMREQIFDLKLKLQDNERMLSKINEVDEAAHQVNEKINKINHRLLDLEKMLTDQNKIIQMLKKSEINKNKTNTDFPDKKETLKMQRSFHQSSLPSYSLFSVVPGRAWLKSSTGATTTVVVGSVLPGYGSITLIEARRGIVLTNKGHVFRFEDK